MKTLLIGAAAIAVALTVACGGGSDPIEEYGQELKAEQQAASPAIEVSAVTPEPKVLDEEWACEQVTPRIKEGAEAVLAEEYSRYYDLFAMSEGCTHSQFVSNFAGTWMLAQGFRGDEVLKALVQDLEDGTFAPTFTEITEERITDVLDDPADPTIVVREDGEWRFLDDGKCGCME